MTTESLRTKCRAKRANQIENLLETDLAYNTIKHEIQKKGNETPVENFANSKYSTGQKYRFPYSLESALVVIESCQYYTNSYDFLLKHYFTEDELNIHSSLESLEIEEVESKYEDQEYDEYFLENSKFAKSNLSQQAYFESLEISGWKYEDFVISAIYIHIEQLCQTYLKRKNTAKNKSFSELKLFSSHVGLFLLNSIYGKQLFTTLQKTNLFVIYPDCWLHGFRAILHYHGSDYMIKSYEQQDRLLFFQNTSRRFPVNFSYISFYLQAFASFIPLSVIHPVSKYCYLTKSVHVLYYILEKYEVPFSSKLDELEKEYADYYLTSHLHNELNTNSSKNSFFNTLGKFLNDNSVWFPLFLVLITGSYTNVNVMAGIPPNLGKNLPTGLPSTPNLSSSKPIKPLLKKTSLEKKQKKDQKNLGARENLQKAKMDSDQKWQKSFGSNPNFKFETASDLASRPCLIAYETKKKSAYPDRPKREL
jgi:hypothetical protein